MMTKEEVVEIMTYCKEHGVSYQARLDELGIPKWLFYRYKSRYAAEQASGKSSEGEFIELPQGGPFVPVPSFAATSGRRGKGPAASQGPDAGRKCIEIRTDAGAAIRIQGNLSEKDLYSIVKACSHVQP